MRGFFDLKNPTLLPVFFIHSSVHERKNDLKLPTFFPHYESINKGKTNHRVKRGYYMISKTMEQALNKQVNREFYSAYLYLSLIHISAPTRQAEISYAVFCLKKK